MNLLTARGLSISFDKRRVLDNVSLTIDKGEIVTIVGPNGAGKSSLVRLLVGEIIPEAGEVVLSPEARLGYVPQKLQLQGHVPLTVSRFLKLRGARKETLERAKEILQIAPIADYDMRYLSGGELKRVLLAYALADAPNLLILDEPTAGLDQPAMFAFYEMIARLRREMGIAFVLVSHDLNIVMSASDRVICLNVHICCEGTAGQIVEQPEFKTLFGSAAAPVTFFAHEHSHSHDGTLQPDHHEHEDCAHDE